MDREWNPKKSGVNIQNLWNHHLDGIYLGPIHGNWYIDLSFTWTKITKLEELEENKPYIYMDPSWVYIDAG